MKPNKRILENSSILWWIFGGASSITLYFNSKIQDPFNSPKMWLLFAIGAWLLGHIASKYKDVKFNNSLKILISITLVFTILNFISALNTENLYTAFFGENQRRNGFLTYLFLVIFLIASAMFITISSIKRLNYIAFVTGLILAIYGLMQISGLDFIKWNNPYNAIISTVGNPNFAAAVMAMMSSIIFGSVLNSSFNLYYRLASAVLTLLLLFTIYLSDARQGLISIAIGIGVYVLIWLYSKKHKLRHTLFGASIIVGVLSILGMLQIGPLTSFLYKSSVTVRGYYWRAGIEMIRDNPIFGVGIDRYGAYFKEFRDVGYPLNYGFTITSTNAHNVPIQIFATSGLFTGVAYLSLLGFIAWRGIKSIRNSEGNDKLFVASIFSAWLAYQAQSIISIDNIGISIWGWVLGGAVIGLSLERNAEFSNSSKSFKNNKNLVKFNFFQASISSVSLLIVIFVIVPLYKAEKNMYETRMRYNPQVAESRSPFYDFATCKLHF
jgi:O-antigen ligase